MPVDQAERAAQASRPAAAVKPEAITVKDRPDKLRRLEQVMTQATEARAVARRETAAQDHLARRREVEAVEAERATLRIARAVAEAQEGSS